jgi:ferredoxin
MIVAEQKPIQEILAMIPKVDKLLVLGCDTCVTVCLAGGEKEVRVLCAAIRMSDKGIGTVVGKTVERQCDPEFLAEIAGAAQDADAILSMGCGAGIQMLADTFPTKIVLPAVNTLFMGSNESAGYWMERCVGCGDCVLHLTGGICPRTRCSKGLMNGPCGGAQNGMCEVDPQNIECGWNLIYERLKALNQLDRLMEIQPPQDWSKTHDGGPRRLIREDVKL